MTHGRPTRISAVTIHGPAGRLEGLIQEHEGAHPALAVLVCHPHPSYGGTLHNKVTHRVASTLHQLGAVALRFNFRGVGRSEGTYDRGAGEVEDARAALEFLRVRHPGARRWAAGFSFGSWIAARLAASEPGVERLILVAPPVGTESFGVLHRSPVPKLVLQGTADDVCPLDRLEQEFPSWAGPKELVRIAGATHFFDRQLGALADALSHAVAGLVAGGTS